MARHYRGLGFVIASQDEATFGLIPNVARGWARKGSRPVAVMNYKHECTNVFGARSKRAFVFSFSKKKNQRRFVEFMELLLKRWKKVCLFTDNAPWHKGKLVDDLLKRHPKTFRLIRFPKYAPELNPVEPCWKPARKTLANRMLRSVSAMKYHLRKTFRDKKAMPKMFKYLTD